MQYVMMAIIGVVCALIGGTFAMLPRRTEDMDDLQRRVAKALGIVFCVLFFVFMVLQRDPETWAVIIGGLVGYAIGCIPPLRRTLRQRYTLFAPPAKKPTRRR